MAAAAETAVRHDDSDLPPAAAVIWGVDDGLGRWYISLIMA